MAAPIGNEYYKLRSKDGRDKQYETPEALAGIANEYFEWCMENPLKEQLTFHAQGLITKTDSNKMRPFTLEGLCNFLDLSIKGFRLYEDREDFIHVTTRIRQIIDTQQFEGAAAGFLNPNIIARKLGLSERTDHTTNGKDLPAGPTTIVFKKFENQDGE